VSAKAQEKSIATKEIKIGRFFLFFMNAAAEILSMTEDWENGGRARFHMLITF
jgi:hypothetical protein